MLNIKSAIHQMREKAKSKFYAFVEYLWSVSRTEKSVLEDEIIKMVIDNISDREVKDVMEPLFSQC